MWVFSLRSLSLSFSLCEQLNLSKKNSPVKMTPPRSRKAWYSSLRAIAAFLDGVTTETRLPQSAASRRGGLPFLSSLRRSPPGPWPRNTASAAARGAAAGGSSSSSSSSLSPSPPPLLLLFRRRSLAPAPPAPPSSPFHSPAGNAALAFAISPASLRTSSASPSDSLTTRRWWDATRAERARLGERFIFFMGVFENAEEEEEENEVRTES